MNASEDPDPSFGSSFYPHLRLPSRGVRIAVQSAFLLIVGMVALVFPGLSFDLTPWSQVMINQLVERLYPDPGQEETTVVLFQEKNLRELGAGYPVSYEVQADVLEALASYGPRAVFIDFVFMDPRPNPDRLRTALCKLSAAVDGRLYLAAPIDDASRVMMQRTFEGCAQLVSALAESDTGMSGVLTYCSGTWSLQGCEERANGAAQFIPSAAFAMAKHRVADIAPKDGERMEILWPSKTSELNRKWMKCDRRGDPWTRLLARLKRDDPLELKEDCPYTATLSVAHLLGTFDPDVERAIRNKAVFYGAAFDAATDRVISPTYHDLPGVYLHAMAYDNLVSLGKDYKRADRLAWRRPTWRGAMADLGLLVALIVLWVVAGDARRPRPLVDRAAPHDVERAPKAFVDRLALTILLGVGALALIRSGTLASEGAVLLTLLVGYWAYKVLLKKDGLFLIASVLVALAAVGSSSLLNLGPRNVIGYLAFFEITRHLTEYLDRGARRYIRFRADFPADSEWGRWAHWRPWLDSLIAVWLRGRVQKEDGMTKRTPLILRVVLMSLAAAFAAAASAASADEPTLAVRKLRTDPVALYKCHDLSKPALLVAQEDFRSGRSKGPWAASKDADNPMFLRVWVDSDPYCVKAHLVETNAPVPATKADAECKTSSGKQPKPAFARGVGEGC